ncbi:uncharacterized protein LY79DRAFT_166223 [Colletotrichum navitas]|uniref:Uncharacterized protein n=1 Tax=Colletotrichum navitas TaxID=681940 RepID=A0AAD8Q1W6_9PEZI|nr:uncharacterized protein LY79DRAFT_166223 [Colletotrichum navitas]KAK1593994.1 hypothetical protein LY79DRAFT_166223 [Colletotrichum navitas]
MWDKVSYLGLWTCSSAFSSQWLEAPRSVDCACGVQRLSKRIWFSSGCNCSCLWRGRGYRVSSCLTSQTTSMGTQQSRVAERLVEDLLKAC